MHRHRRVNEGDGAHAPRRGIAREEAHVGEAGAVGERLVELVAADDEPVDLPHVDPGVVAGVPQDVNGKLFAGALGVAGLVQLVEVARRDAHDGGLTCKRFVGHMEGRFRKWEAEAA